MKPELMSQSVYNLWIPLCDFLWDLPAVGYRAGQKLQQAGPTYYRLGLYAWPMTSVFKI